MLISPQKHCTGLRMKPSFYQYSLPELEQLFLQNGLPPSGPSLLYNWHYKKKNITPCLIDLAKTSISFVSNFFDFYLPQIHTIHESSDKTVKFLLELRDGEKIEAVLIPFNKKYTLCLSSQVGCAVISHILLDRNTRFLSQ
jgi:23S rRNA (adenine2503-C2)-methyltransferase